MPRRHGAWVRYGAPLTTKQVDFAISNYQVAILQPWETHAPAAIEVGPPGYDGALLQVPVIDAQP